jgi:Zn-dependent protease with chaperone function
VNNFASGDDSEGGSDAEVALVEYDRQPSDAKARRVRMLRLTVGFTIFAVVIALAVVRVISDEYPYAFGLGAVLLVQFVVIAIRVRRMSGPVLTDPEAESRISPILSELCAAAQCAVPRVSIRRTTVPAGIIVRSKQPVLLISPDFLAATDDASLRAILAHEVAHLSAGDISIAKRRSQFAVLGTELAGVVVWIVLGQKTGVALLLWVLYFIPCIQLYLRFTGSQVRRRETHADMAGAAALGDPDAMIRGLEIVYGLTDLTRESLYGGSGWKWMSFPWSLQPRTHPPLAQRIARLRLTTTT